MIFVTGDTHIPIDVGKLNTDSFPIQRELTKKDYVIICGDFGGIWDNSRQDVYWLKWLDSKPWTTLFVDGNHENFDLLNSYPVVQFKHGKAHKINDSVYHLMRGQIYKIEGKTFFTMGGAESHDRPHFEGKGWWELELPTDKEYDEAIKNLDKVNWKVDYIITHSAPDRIQDLISRSYTHNKLTNFLRLVDENCRFRHWYFGHYHMSREITSKHTVLYDEIIKLNWGS